MIAEVGLDRCAAPTNARIELANRPGRNARLVESMVTSTRPERDGEAAVLQIGHTQPHQMSL